MQRKVNYLFDENKGYAPELSISTEQMVGYFHYFGRVLFCKKGLATINLIEMLYVIEYRFLRLTCSWSATFRNWLALKKNNDGSKGHRTPSICVCESNEYHLFQWYQAHLAFAFAMDLQCH